MSNNLYIVLAICVGQVPGGGSPYAPIAGGSPYSPTYQPAAYQQSVSQPVPHSQSRPVFHSTPYSQLRPQGTGPVRNWLQNNFASPKGKADCGCSSQGTLPAVSSHGKVYIAPRAGTTNVTQPEMYHPVQRGPSVPVVTETSAGIYEESMAPTFPQNPQPVYQYEEGEYYQEQYLQPGQEAPFEVQDPQPVASTLQVAKKYENQIGHEEDYSWITGHLFYVNAGGGRWVVRYALPDEIDKFGGSVILTPGVEMKNFREGDLVCIYGEIMDEGRTSRSLGGALYRVNSILMIERADP